ncbi:MAG TPA: nitrate reductase molybdenum cofactor assembly chaperone [Mycobacterium sp.]
MKLLTWSKRSDDDGLADRAVWQAASLLLAYPDEQHEQRLDTVDSLLAHLNGKAAELLARTVAELRAKDLLAAATEYVETFDLRRRSTMYLTYWTGGDTRNRGTQMVAFIGAYRRAGVTPPQDEGPDHLPVLLEFAATVDPQRGRRLLVAHRVPLDVVQQSLAAAQSPYAHTIAAVCETLPAVTDSEVQRVQQLAEVGPPAESVGLQPYTLTGPTPDSMTGIAGG